MKNPNSKTPAQQQALELPEGMSRDFLKTIGIVIVIVLVVMRWNDFISIFTNALLLIYSLLAKIHAPGAFGWAIILFTILIRVITWPINAQQMKGAQAMQEMQNDKEWQAIQKKYSKPQDREKLQSEQMRIYRERGINPFASCLPTLIQFPILIGLYQSIIRSLGSTPLSLLQLSQSAYSFINISSLIPLNSKFLWMNLGQPEPYYILAIVVAVTTYIQSKLTMPPSTNPNDQTAAMSQSMTLTMPLMLGWFALTFASGISVYFVTSNLLGIIQYAATGRANWRNLLPGAQQPKKK